MAFHVGILGAGNISETHARAASEIPDVRVVAVAGSNAAKVERLAALHGAKGYTSTDELVRHRPLDAVLIGSPSGLHAEQGIAAARQGLHVLVEKSIDVDTQRGRALVAECERAGVKLGVFFQDRFAPEVERLKAAIESGLLGRPLLVSARVKWWRPAEYYAGSRWRGRPQVDGGGAVLNQGIHTLDLLLWLLGDVARVQARAATALHAIEVEDTLVATLEFASGVLGTFEATTAAYPGYPRVVELTGTQGTVTFEHDRIVRADLREGAGSLAPTARVAAAESASSPVISDTSGHRAAIEDLLRAIRDDGRPRCDGAEGLRSLVLTEALYRSARTHEAVDVGR